MGGSERPDEAVTTRVSQKGQTTIPKGIRERLGIESGDRVAWTDDGTQVVIERKTTESCLGAAVPDGTSEEQRKAMAAELDEYVKQRRRNRWDGPAADSPQEE